MGPWPLPLPPSLQVQRLPTVARAAAAAGGGGGRQAAIKVAREAFIIFLRTKNQSLDQ